MSKSIASSLLLLMVISSVHSLKCYSCDSSKGIQCEWGLLSFIYSSVECEAQSGSGFLDAIASVIPMTCAKIVGKDQEGTSYTARGCVPKGTALACGVISKTMQFADSKEISGLECSTCDSDNCNSATRMGGMTFVGLLAASFLFLF